MLVEQIWTNNSYRNFNYLVACPETGEALAIDPLEAAMCLKIAKDKGWQITQILNTHEHSDHTGGNAAVVAATGAKVIAHKDAKDKIPGMDRGLSAGDIIKVGKTVELEALDTPGHTMSHICLRSHTDTPCLFCGDTLFNAGAGNTKGGGDPVALYATFTRQLAMLPENTIVYPGHDYLVNNLGFTLDREPDNAAAKELLAKAKNEDPAARRPTTISDEKEINTFFRLHSPSVIEKLRVSFPDLPKELDTQTVFVKLRELRNSW